MKYMATWTVQSDKKQQITELLAQMPVDVFKTQHGENITLIGRWHDQARGTGVAIFETDDIVALNLWIMGWMNLVDFDVLVPVVDDDEASAIAVKHVAASQSG